MSLIDSMFWELSLILAKFSGNKALLELVFPTSVWTRFCSPPLSCLFTWLLSGVTVVWSCRLLRSSSQPASPFKSSPGSADTAFSMKLYSAAVFQILRPQGLQTRSDKVWFRDKESPVDPQHSAKRSPALQGENKFSKETLAPSDVKLAPHNLQLFRMSATLGPLPRFLGPVA